MDRPNFCGPDNFISEHLLYMYRQQQERRAYCSSIIEGLMSVLFSHLLQNHQESLELSRDMTQFDRRMGAVIIYLGSHYRTAALAGTARSFLRYSLKTLYLRLRIQSTLQLLQSHIMQFKSLTRSWDHS